MSSKESLEVQVLSSRPEASPAVSTSTGIAVRPTSAKPAGGEPGQHHKGNNAHVDIFVRVRPVERASNRLTWDLQENKLEFNLPREAAAGYVNNQRENYEFRFNGILGPEAKQDEVFERVARSLVMGSLEGYNGTIFAYGQTGSGKTFTITGGPMHYADRGIIPRTISTIFSEITKRSDHQFTVHVSYLEIYNETGYDLLDPDRDIKAMEDLPQVHVLEDEEQGTTFRNLNIHRANNEEEALNLLFLGDTNRTISETPMNQASSRSHCIFTLYIEARKHGEDVVRHSKLNLVDLAGSERASKTGIDGTTLREAKYINLSLHYLEQVIIALQERSMGLNRPHIPYRNSKMTQVLRDSLGGNCRTVMIANITSEQMQLDESISTCRFAMRVALVRNVVALNEEVDPALVIRRLKQEVRELREEIRLLKGGEEERGPLTPDELRRLQEQVDAYCADNSSEAALNLSGGMLFIRAAFLLFKQMVISGGGLRKPGAAGTAGSGDAGSDLNEQVKKLKLQVVQRDNEINILVGMLKRRDNAAAAGLPVGGLGGFGAGVPSVPAVQGSTSTPAGSAPPVMLLPPAGAATASQGLTGQQVGGIQGQAGAAASTAHAAHSSGAASPSPSGPGASPAQPVADGPELLLDASLLADRNQAFELFRKSYRQNEVIETNKAALRTKYDAAKAAAARVNDAKARISQFKALIEQRRIQRGVAQMTGNDDGSASQSDPEEERCKSAIEKEKVGYKDAFDELRTLKQEIEHLHLVLEQSRTRLQRDFEQWMGLMDRQAAAAANQRTVKQSPQAVSGWATSPSSTVLTPGSHMSSSPSSMTTSIDMSRGGYGAAGILHSGLKTGPGVQPGLLSGVGLAGAVPGQAGSLSGQAPRPQSSGSPGGGLLRASSYAGFTAQPTGSQPARPAQPSAGAGWAVGASQGGQLTSPAQQPSNDRNTLASTKSVPMPKQAWTEAPANMGAAGSSTPHSPGADIATSMSSPHTTSSTSQLDLKSVDPQVLAAARPYLTGNPDADQDIIRFYIAKQQLLAKLQAAAQ